MSNSLQNDCTPEDERVPGLTQAGVSSLHATQPQDEPQQEEFLREYRLQLERLSCPGCGEDAPLF